jgi:hypothetical protein
MATTPLVIACAASVQLSHRRVMYITVEERKTIDTGLELLVFS